MELTVRPTGMIDESCKVAHLTLEDLVRSWSCTAYHDIHHQSWGIKTNFSQPFFIFWDRMLNTQWKGEVKLRYERARENAQKQVDMDTVQAAEAAAVPVREEPEHEPAVVSSEGPAARTRLRRKTVDSLKGPSHGVPGSVLHN